MSEITNFYLKSLIKLEAALLHDVIGHVIKHDNLGFLSRPFPTKTIEFRM